jgi:hypothetical protein
MMTPENPNDPLTNYLSAVRGAGETAERRGEIAWLEYLGALERERGDQPLAIRKAGAQFLGGLLNDESLAQDPSLAAEQESQLGYAVYRAADRAQRNIRADQDASFLEAMALRENAIEAAAQDITVNPQAQRALDAGLAGVWRDLVNLGPREGFTLGEIAVPQDATRAGALSADEANRRYQAVSDRAVEAIVWGQFQVLPRDEDATGLLDAFPQLREDQRARLSERMRAASAALDIQTSQTRAGRELDARGAVGEAHGAASAEGFALLRAGALRADWLAEHGGALDRANLSVLQAAVTAPPAQDERATLAALSHAAEDADPGEFAARAAQPVRAGRLTAASYQALLARNGAAEPAPHRTEYLRLRDGLSALAPRESAAREALAAPRDAALDEFERWRSANPQATPGEARKAADEVMTRARSLAWERARARLEPPAGFGGAIEALTIDDLTALQRASVAALDAGQLAPNQAVARLRAIDEWRSALMLSPTRGEG